MNESDVRFMKGWLLVGVLFGWFMVGSAWVFVYGSVDYLPLVMPPTIVMLAATIMIALGIKKF